MVYSRRLFPLRQRSIYVQKNLEEIQSFNKAQYDAATAAASTFVKGLKQLADETAEFTKKHYEASSSTVEKFIGAKSLEDKIPIQTDFAKSTCEGLLAQGTKVGALYSDLAKEVFKPLANAFVKAPANS